MTTITAESKAAGFDMSYNEKEFSWPQRLALRRSHPISIFIDLVAWTWFVYFLWNRNWQAALVTVVAARLLALSLVRGLNFRDMAETGLGKLALLHLHPVNLSVQLIGFFIFLFGIWNRTSESILFGVSVVLFGHLFGWSKVDRRFALQHLQTK